ACKTLRSAAGLGLQPFILLGDQVGRGGGAVSSVMIRLRRRPLHAARVRLGIVVFGVRFLAGRAVARPCVSGAFSGEKTTT
ncbi:MAG: hypothetical protein ACKOTF_07810, partial [Opitutaceae bacterium]